MADVEELDDALSDETSEEQALRSQAEVVLSASRQKLVDFIVDRLMIACDSLSGHPLRPYQVPCARRIFESLVISDGARITALFCRQSGKTELVANVISTAMIFLPRLAKVYPDLLGKFKEGVLVGAFAPVDEQADTIFGRIVARLSSDEAEALLKDPEIDDRVRGRGRRVWLQNCLSEVRKTTCHPKAKIEGRTYHIILVDEAQDSDTKTINKSVSPMGTSTRATHIWTGTCTYNKNVFYDQIQKNKRAILRRGKYRQNHFEADWKEVAKHVPLYRDAVYDEMESMGSDSDEFRLSYNLEWLLDKGQFTTAEKFAELGDITVQSLEHDWFHSPVVVGIDCGRKQDKTIVTVVWVDWDHPDAFGFYEHRIINWLDLEGLEWEDQYFRIYEFLQHYKVQAVGVDTGGIGDVVMGRLQVMMPHLNFVECPDGPAQQSDRFKYLKTLMERHKMIWPMGAKVRRLKVFRRFRQEMEDAELEYKGPNIVVAAPNERDAHDDYVDSLANAVSLTRGGDNEKASQETVVYDSFLFRPRSRYGNSSR
jgi:terminase large subunit-like protein